MPKPSHCKYHTFQEGVLIVKRNKIRYLIFILAGLLLLGLSPVSFGQDPDSEKTAKSNQDTTIYLHAGSPLILSGEEILSLDPENFDVAATIIDGRTLIPLRSIAEYFGADVSYKAKENTAIIRYGNKEYIFPIGKSYYGIKENDKTKNVALDSPAVLMRDRTMVPLRVVAENILDRKVFYKDDVIAISSKTVNLNDPDLVSQIKSKIGTAVKARSEKQLARLTENTNKVYRLINDFSDIAAIAEKTRESSADMDAGPQDEVTHSKTNVQVEGIDEADIVKTDGRHIYIAGHNALRIVEADGPLLSEAALIKFPDEKNIAEIYVDDSRLVIIGNRYDSDDNKIYPSDKGAASAIMPPVFRSFSFVDVYDIKNPKDPILLKNHEMEGHYQSSRKSGSHVYLVTNSYPANGVLPLMKDTIKGDKIFRMAIDDVMIIPGCRSFGYTALSAIDIEGEKETNVEAVAASGYAMYMNDTSIYFAGGSPNGNTIVTKFKIDGMNIGYAGGGEVKGTIINQFSMDEYQGNLRIATGTWQNENALYVLNESLNVIGSVTGFAKGESIYSVRFLGDKGYIVTFERIDPLFVFDLLDPENPKLTGELEVPGFSSYLHPVSPGLILGIGADTQEIYTRDQKGKETVIGTRQSGVKLSLFDVSDMGKPKELASCVIGDSGSSAEAMYNHKAVMIDPVKETIAFDVYIANDKNWKDSKQGALVIGLKDRKIIQKGLLPYTQPEVYGKYIPAGRRIVYIGDTLYYIQDGIVKAYDYTDLTELSQLELK